MMHKEPGEGNGAGWIALAFLIGGCGFACAAIPFILTALRDAALIR